MCPMKVSRTQPSSCLVTLQMRCSIKSRRHIEFSSQTSAATGACPERNQGPPGKLLQRCRPQCARRRAYAVRKGHAMHLPNELGIPTRQTITGAKALPSPPPPPPQPESTTGYDVPNSTSCPNDGSIERGGMRHWTEPRFSSLGGVPTSHRRPVLWEHTPRRESSASV